MVEVLALEELLKAVVVVAVRQDQEVMVQPEELDQYH
jgi:hypothetical protein